jgi:hypothetical protein
MRGVALVAMVSSHVDHSVSTVLGDVLHSAVWIDGAFIFVALSGFVAGLVHRRIVERDGVRPSVTKLARRAGWIYAVHVALMAAIVISYNAHPTTAFEHGIGWSGGSAAVRFVGDLLLLKRSPEWNNVLPMYVFFLLWAAVAVILLARKRWWLVAGISLSVYVFSQAVNGLAIQSGSFALGGWQLLFTIGLLVGWVFEWERLSLSVPLRRALVVSAAVVAAVLFLVARLRNPTVEDVLGTSIQKYPGGWIAFAFAGTALVVGFVVFRRLGPTRAGRAITSVLALLGRKGLPGYAAMVLALLVLNEAPWVPRNDLTVLAVVAVCGLAELGAVQRDERRRVRSRAPAPPSPGPVATEVVVTP